MRLLLQWLFVCSLAVFLTACTGGGGGDSSGGDSSGGDSTAGGGDAAGGGTDAGGGDDADAGGDDDAGASSAAATGTAVVKGKVTLAGAAPEMPSLLSDMTGDPICFASHTPDSPPKAQTVIAGEGGSLANVIVYVSKGISARFPPVRETAKLDQKGCLYEPHVFAVRAGQPIEITNSDQTLHNIHTTSDQNGEFNRGQPKGSAPLKLLLKKPEVAVNVKCDVHPWMNARIGVFSHPFFAVTGPDGTFELGSKLPAGTYTLSFWHEKYGEKTQEITVADGDNEANFEFTAG